MQKLWRLLVMTGVLVGVFGTFIEISYRASLSRGLLPATYIHGWPFVWLAASCGLAALGAWSTQRIVAGRWRLVIAAAYAILLMGGLLALHLVVACRHGDCF